MKQLQKRAYAKINLGLDVTGRLENGYHLVKMIMQTVGICDVLTFTLLEEDTIPADGGYVLPVIEMTTDNGELPTDENNLIYKAAKRFMERFEIRQGVKIHLEKHIPIAAGMAGGSTDAAATLKGLNELFAIGADIAELCEIGVKIGADVPYCIIGGTVLAEGIGEKLTTLPDAPNPILLVAKPEINVSTKFVYEHIDQEGVESHPDIDGMIRAIEEKDLQGITDRLGNVLELVTVKAHPIINEIKKVMTDAGAMGSLMSGSGPTVFGIFIQEEQAKAALEQIQKENLAKQVFITEFCDGNGGTYAR